MSDVVIVGGGLSGLALSVLLTRQAIPVQVFEARERMHDAARSINLALSARGIRTLDALGMTTQVLRPSVPMYGRCIHAEGLSDDFQPYDLVGKNAVYSIRRADLWQALVDKATASGIKLHTGCRCTQIDSTQRTLHFRNREGTPQQAAYDVLIGCDGVRSTVRRSLVEAGSAVEKMVPLGHGYIELHMPAELGAMLHPHALHIWPRERHMLIALPNADHSFTATLFFPWQAEQAAEITRDGLRRLFNQHFASAAPLIADLDKALANHPLTRLFSCQCTPWTAGGSLLLLGDAAHTMAPFYGQGMNCALEDCLLLADSLQQFRGDWPAALDHFERTRKPDAEAIAQLSDENYREMSHEVVRTEFKKRRQIERKLQLRHPDTYIPLYAMIAFTTLPYAEALRRGRRQAKIIDDLYVLGDLEKAGVEVRGGGVQRHGTERH